MLGFFSGIILAIWFRKDGPQRPVYEWMEEEEGTTRDGTEEERSREPEGGDNFKGKNTH
jgi:hypothetical protein